VEAAQMWRELANQVDFLDKLSAELRFPTKPDL
jgi:hypothetical protein